MSYGVEVEQEDRFAAPRIAPLRWDFARRARRPEYIEGRLAEEAVEKSGSQP
jgi:hypothetical protein